MVTEEEHKDSDVFINELYILMPMMWVNFTFVCSQFSDNTEQFKVTVSPYFFSVTGENKMKNYYYINLL